MCWFFLIQTQNPDYGNIKRSDNGDHVVISGREAGGGGGLLQSLPNLMRSRCLSEFGPLAPAPTVYPTDLVRLTSFELVSRRLAVVG